MKKKKKENFIFQDFFLFIALVSLFFVVVFVLNISITIFSHIAMVNHHTTVFLGRLL